MEFFDRVTRVGAQALLAQSGIFDTPPTTPLVIFDNACGTGVVSALLYSHPSMQDRDMTVLAGDIAPFMVQAAQEQLEREGWKSARVESIDAQDTKLLSDHFTHVLTNFGIMLMPRSLDALKECFRVAKPGGCIAFTTWNYAAWHDIYTEAVSRIPGVTPLSFAGAVGPSGAWYDPEFVRSQLVAHTSTSTSTDIKINLHEFTFPIESAHSFVENWSRMLPVLIGHWSDEDKKEKGGLVMPGMEKVLEERYGVDKPFEMRMVAIVATATKPTV